MKKISNEYTLRPTHNKREKLIGPRREPYESPCPHFPNWVGWPFIKLPYPEQLLRKREIVRRAFAEYGALTAVEIPPVAPSPERLGYRARVKLVVRRNRGDVAVGLFVPQTHRVIDIS